MDVRVEQVREGTAEVWQEAARLLPQLGLNRTKPSRDTVEALVMTPNHALFVGRLGESVAGMLTLALIKAVDGRVTAWIEDVVVDEAARGHGVGNALVGAAIEASREAGAHRILLRSARAREAAHRLYRRHGFEERPSPVLRLDLTHSGPAIEG